MDYTRLPVVVVLDNVRSLYNTGAFFRTADACAIEKLVLCGITPDRIRARNRRHAISKTALGADESVAWEFAASTASALEAAIAAGYHVAAVETSPQAVDLYDWAPVWPLCLVFGHETEGVSPAVAGYCQDARTNSDARSEALAQCGHGGRGGLVRTAAKAQRTPSVGPQDPDAGLVRQATETQSGFRFDVERTLQPLRVRAGGSLRSTPNENRFLVTLCLCGP